MEVENDSELILKLQAGSLEALGILYDRHRYLVFRTALGITGDVDAAADLLQDVFLRLHRFAAHIDAERPLELALSDDYQFSLYLGQAPWALDATIRGNRRLAGDRTQGYSLLSG